MGEAEAGITSKVVPILVTFLDAFDAVGPKA